MTASDNTRVGVVIMAKRPIPGRVKTRLGAELSPQETAGFYAAMLADRCAQVLALEDVVPAIAFAPGEPGDTEPAVSDVFRRVPQPEGGLGAGLAAAASFLLAESMAVVLVDSDSPTLPMEYVQIAADLLRERSYDLVIGPAEDGGYYLLGLSRPAPELFEGIAWSTSDVTRQTVERAGKLGLRVYELPTWWDVDEPNDFRRLEKELFKARWPARTADWFRAHRAEPVPPGAGSAELWCEPWKRLSSRTVYATPWLDLREDWVETPAGQRTTYSVVDIGEAVGVLPFVDADTVLLVRQYRYIAGRVMWEMPTGGVHAGESPEVAARRELAEEAQVRAGRLESLGTYHTSKSVMNETAHLFVGRELEAVTAMGDDTEFIRAERVPFARVLDMVLSGEIMDSMTIIAVLRVAHGV